MISGLGKTLILLFDLLDLPIPLPAAVVPPQLQLIVSADRWVAAPGETVTFSINYSNDASGGTATSAVISSALPRFSSFVGAMGDETALLASAPPQGGQGNVVWNLPLLNPGQSGQVTMLVAADTLPDSNNQLLYEDFESPQYLIGENPSLRAPEIWQSASPLLYKIVADPLRPGGQRVLIGSGPAGDASGSKTLNSAASFSGTVGVEMRVHAKSSAIQEYASMGLVQISFDSTVFAARLLFGDIDPAPAASLTLRSGQDYLLQYIYDADLSGLAVRMFPVNNPALLASGSSCGNPSASQIRLSMFNNQASNSLLTDDISVHRALLAQAQISAPGAVSRRACGGAMLTPPRLSSPTPLPSRTFSVTPTPSLSPSFSQSPSVTPTQTATLTSTQTPSTTETFSETEAPSQTPTQTPSATESVTEINTATSTPRATVSSTPTGTTQPSSKGSPTPRPTATREEEPRHSCVVAGPNPVHKRIVIQFHLEKACRARMTLRSLDGSVVFTKHLGERSRGEGREEIACENLADGFYWLELRSEHEGRESTEGRFKVAVRHGELNR